MSGTSRERGWSRKIGTILIALGAAALPANIRAMVLLGPSGVSFPVGSSPDDVAIADFDADGAPDLAELNGNSSSVSVLVGDAFGAFVRRCRSTEGGECREVSASSPRSVALGDLDRDGALDLAIASQGSRRRDQHTTAVRFGV